MPNRIPVVHHPGRVQQVGLGFQLRFAPLWPFGFGGSGSQGGGQPKGGPKIWANPPGWARAGAGGSDDQKDPDDKSPHAPAGVIFVGIGGSQFAGQGLFGPLPGPFGRR